MLPVYNAMPYLTVCIRDVLRQEGGGLMICAWDGGDVDAWEFLVEVAQRCGRVEVVDAPAPPTSSKPSAAKDDVPAWAPSQNPALGAAPRHDENEDHPAIERSPCEPLSADAVAQACVSNTLRVVKYRDGLNRGQGAAMSLALARSTAPLIAQMEADDRRPNPRAFALMVGPRCCEPSGTAAPTRGRSGPRAG